MKEQITKTGKVEFSRAEVMGILNKWLQDNKGYRCKSMVFEPAFEKVIGLVEFHEGERVEDKYHPELKRRLAPSGVTRPNHGFTEELRAYLEDLAKEQKARTVIFTYDQAKIHFVHEFPQLSDELLGHYLVRSDMHDRAKITIIKDNDQYIGQLL